VRALSRAGYNDSPEDHGLQLTGGWGRIVGSRLLAHAADRTTSTGEHSCVDGKRPK
jgi:hypothetical protein